MVNKFLKVLRVKSWIKNLLIFSPYFLSGIFSFPTLLKLGATFFAFSLLVSSTYIFNDLIDIDSDKLHPIKKNRPIATGYLSFNFWISMSSLFLVLGNYLLFIIDKSLLLYSSLYLVITVLYSTYFKFKKYFDILSISTLFALRVLLGSQASETYLSIWFVIFIFLICLGLVSGKKLSIVSDKDISSSKVKDFLLKNYNKAQLKNIIIVSFTSSIITFSFWILIKYSLVSTNKFLLLLSSIIFLIYFFVQFYFSAISGETEDIVTSIMQPKNFISLTLFSILILSGLS